MSIMYCEKHDLKWDSDLKSECPACEGAFVETELPLLEAILQRHRELTGALHEQLLNTGLVTTEQWNKEIAPHLCALRLAIDKLATHIIAEAISDCIWTFSGDEWEIWETTCGNSWHFEEGDPAHNNFKWCGFCGKPLKTWDVDVPGRCAMVRYSVCEDELPANITDAEYDAWYAESRVIDGVRMGPKLTRHY